MQQPVTITNNYSQSNVSVLQLTLFTKHNNYGKHF